MRRPCGASAGWRWHKRLLRWQCTPSARLGGHSGGWHYEESSASSAAFSSPPSKVSACTHASREKPISISRWTCKEASKGHAPVDPLNRTRRARAEHAQITHPRRWARIGGLWCGEKAVVVGQWSTEPQTLEVRDASAHAWPVSGPW